MKRQIIEIDQSKCDGCGKCVGACHEGALAMVGGKARLVKEVFCDGLGACIGDCPRGALTVVEREAPAFDAAAVQAAQRPALRLVEAVEPPRQAHGGCPGSALRVLGAPPAVPAGAGLDAPPPSSLSHWPVQLMLVPPHAPFLQHADLVVCADCVPFTVPDFHARYLAGRAVVIGCPKLDDLSVYAQKLQAMVRQSRPARLTVLRMEVPCCRGITQVAVEAALESGLDFPVEEHVIGVRGGIARNVVRPASAQPTGP